MLYECTKLFVSRYFNLFKPKERQCFPVWSNSRTLSQRTRQMLYEMFEPHSILIIMFYPSSERVNARKGQSTTKLTTKCLHAYDKRMHFLFSFFPSFLFHFSAKCMQNDSSECKRCSPPAILAFMLRMNYHTNNTCEWQRRTATKVYEHTTVNTKHK